MKLDNGNEAPNLNSLHRVMRIVYDGEDSKYSCKSRVEILQEEVLKLCTQLMPNSISWPSDPQQILINFNALNKRILPTMGLCGDKQMMVQILRDARVVGNSDIAKMEAGNFEGGLYVGVEGQGIVVFYWHQGEHLQPNDQLSSFFMRYLWELCDSVYACVDGKFNFPFQNLADSVLTMAEKSENIVRLICPGYKVQVDTQLMEDIVIPYKVGSKDKKHYKNLLFCHGYYGCRFLTAEYRAPLVLENTEIEIVETSKLRDTLERWSLDSNIDYSGLSHEDFVYLLKCCQLREYDYYLSLKESFRTRLASSRSAMRSAKLQEFRTSVEENIIPVLCNNLFPLLLSEEDGSCITETDRFDQLHREISIILTGRDGDERIIFAGSEIKFKSYDTSEYLLTIEYPASCPGNRPYVKYEELVNVKCRSGNFEEGKAKFLPINKPKDMVVSGEKLILSINDNTQMEGIVELVDKTSIHSAIRRWVEDLIPLRLKSLETCLGFLIFLTRHGIDVKPIALKVIRQHLSRENIESLPKEIRSLFEEFHKSDSQRLDPEACRTILCDEKLKKVVASQARKYRQEFLENALIDAIKKDIWSAVQKQSDEKEVEKRKKFEKDKERFLTALKLKMSAAARNGKIVTRYPETVRGTFLSGCLDKLKSRFRVENVELKVSVREEYMSAIVWKSCDLVFKSSKCGRRPKVEFSSGPSVELVGISPESEILLHVVFLCSEESLVFIHNFKDCCLHIYRCGKTGLNMCNVAGKPLHTFTRGFDLLSVDEGTRSLALHDREKSTVGIYRFDDLFRNVHWTGVEIDLKPFQASSSSITWMELIPSKMPLELLLVDDTNRVRVLQINPDGPTMKPKHILLPCPLSKACISDDGLFLLVFNHEIQHSGQETMLHIYVLGDTMRDLKKIRLNVGIYDLHRLEVKVAVFESQSYLVLYSPTDEPSFISVFALKTNLAKDVMQLKQTLVQIQDRDPKSEEIERETLADVCPCLDYLYCPFDKFGTNPVLFAEDKRDVLVNVLLGSRNRSESPNKKETCMRYLQALILQFRAEKEIDFSNINIRFQVENFQKWTADGLGIFSESGDKKMEMGIWVRKLICLVPLPIAFAKNNGLFALKDGLEIPPDMTYEDSISLACLMRFGLYDAVLNSWQGKVKVVSSIGKQGSGKSYLLNHLSGSLFDVSDSKCNNGVWMTIRPGDECLYVLLEFKGLVSFKQTEQEDLLLSLFNAAISNLTIFNKKDFSLDKETKMIFNCFQKGSSLVKHDRKLFKGLLCIAIRDVDTPDVEDLIKELHEKITQIWSKSDDNFILKMYDGKFEIATLASYNRSESYKESLIQVAEMMDEVNSYYGNGFNFLRDLKLIIAQIVVKDWIAQIDKQRASLIVYSLRRFLKSAIYKGCLSIGNNSQILVNFDTHDEIPDLPIAVRNVTLTIRDSGLCLAPLDDSMTIRNVLSQLASEIETVFPRKGNDGEFWHSMYEGFVQELADRRCERVINWIKSNTGDFRGHEDVEKLLLEVSVSLETLKQGLAICKSQCSICFRGCMLQRGHSSDHSCFSSHLCTGGHCNYCVKSQEKSVLFLFKCSMCFWRCAIEKGHPSENLPMGNKVPIHLCKKHPQGEPEGEGDDWSGPICADVAGHGGSHSCKSPDKNHTCIEPCDLFETSSNCNKSCSRRPDHPGQHKCNSPKHLCKMPCSHPHCLNTCVIEIEIDHEKHQCYERKCLSKCIMNGCSMTCGVEDHFHDLDPNAEHLCGKEHVCSRLCEMPGICKVATNVVRQISTFEGETGSFSYEEMSEQRHLRLGCCVPIPPFKTNHEGSHVHTKNLDTAHFCEVSCSLCGYFCEYPVNHSDVHRISHGNMRKKKFVADHKYIFLEDHVCAPGETGGAEMCNIFCKKQGRGHTHLIPCPQSNSWTRNGFDGCRHETVKYGPDEHVPKDEMTHEAYWNYLGFVDPYTNEEKQEFALCNYQCRSIKHKSAEPSFCIEKLWHAPIPRPKGTSTTSSGYVTKDGHHFACDHSKDVSHCHVIFVIDKSGSMEWNDITPNSGSRFKSSHNNRLGCVYQAILEFIQRRLEMVAEDSISFVLFDTSAHVAKSIQDIHENLVDCLLQHRADGGTFYSSGLKEAKKLMEYGAKDPTTHMKEPVVIFLSDGANTSFDDPFDDVVRMKKSEPRMKLHTVMFGKDSTTEILNEMAQKGGGKFKQSLTEVELAEGFVGIASGLKPPVSTLIQAS